MFIVVWMSSVLICFFFFFQAEDGIRDRDVTGVQTCALPICVQRGADRRAVVRRRAHALGRDGARGGRQPRHGAVGGNRHPSAVHADLRPGQRARRPGRRARRRHHPGAVELSVRAPGVLPDRRRGRRAGVAARPVRRRAPHRHRRYGVQVLDSRGRGVPHLRRDDRHPAVAAAGPVRSTRMMHGGGHTLDARIRWPEWLPWIAALAAFFLLPEYLSLGARILIYILFALSLDLILGYAGIITLGHSAFFGLGAYVAGILSAKRGITDAFVQMAAAAAAAGLLGALTGAVILRTRALTLLMLTLAITSIILEIANKATWLTGGADGLSGVVVAPILGAF